MKCQMNWKALIFCIIVVIIILLISAITVQPKTVSTESYPRALAQQGEPDPLTCPKAVEATVGENVTLDFHLESQRDATGELIECKFNDSIRVLVYRSGGVSNIQDDRFKSRASLESIDNISKGKVPVKISPVKKTDSGTYRCFIGRGKEKRSCSTELITVERVGNIKAAAPSRSGTSYLLVLAASIIAVFAA